MKHRKRLRLARFNNPILVLSISLLSACTEPDPPGAANDASTVLSGPRDTINPIQKAAQGYPVRLFLYSSRFQQRFSLPASGITPLPDWIQGIALEITRSHAYLPQLICQFDLWTDASRVTTDLTQSAVQPLDSARFFTDYYPINPDDAKAEQAYAQPITNRLLIRTATKEGQTFVSNESIYHYQKALYPGLDFYRFRPPCDALAPSSNAQVHFWLFGSTHTYTDHPPTETSPEKAIYFNALPERLVQKFSEWTPQIRRWNSEHRADFETAWRQYRLLSAEEKGFLVP